MLDTKKLATASQLRRPDSALQRVPLPTAAPTPLGSTLLALYGPKQHLLGKAARVETAVRGGQMMEGVVFSNVPFYVCVRMPTV